MDAKKQNLMLRSGPFETPPGGGSSGQEPRLEACVRVQQKTEHPLPTLPHQGGGVSIGEIRSSPLPPCGGGLGWGVGRFSNSPKQSSIFETALRSFLHRLKADEAPPRPWPALLQAGGREPGQFPLWKAVFEAARFETAFAQDRHGLEGEHAIGPAAVGHDFLV